MSFEAILLVFRVFLGFACSLVFGVIKAKSLDKKVQREENEPLTVAGGSSGAPPHVRWVEPVPGTPHTCIPQETGQAWGPPHTWPRHPPFALVSFVSCSLTTAETVQNRHYCESNSKFSKTINSLNLTPFLNIEQAKPCKDLPTLAK